MRAFHTNPRPQKHARFSAQDRSPSTNAALNASALGSLDVGGGGGSTCAHWVGNVYGRIFQSKANRRVCSGSRARVCASVVHIYDAHERHRPWWDYFAQASMCRPAIVQTALFFIVIVLDAYASTCNLSVGICAYVCCVRTSVRSCQPILINGIF